MPSWKKIISSGSDAALNSLTVTNGITGSLFGTSSFAISASYATTAQNLLGSVTSASFASTASYITSSGIQGILQVLQGGTGVTSSVGANSVVLRDTNINVTANNYFNGFTSVSASGTQIVLTVSSTPSYLVIGSGGQTIKLPDATTLPNGAIFNFNNNQSSGAISINNNSNTLVKSIPSGGYLVLTLIDNSTAAGSWDVHFQAPSNVSWSTNTFDYAGSITSATWNGGVVTTNRGGTGQSSYIDGQILIGSGSTLTKSTLSAGTGIQITTGPGTITIVNSSTSSISASYATTASYVLNAVSSSFSTTASYWSGSILNATSASYAATASQVVGGIGVTSVATTGTVNGITLTGGPIISTGTITLGGSISGLTDSNLSGTAGISNANLANSSITIGSKVISLGGSATTIAGLSSVTSTTFVGALSGTASFATSSSYAVTASYAMNGGGASTPAFPFSGSAVITGSLTITGSVVITGSVAGNVTALTISSNTASLNLNNGNFFTLQLVSGSNTFINPSNIKSGQTTNILISTTGSATVSFPSTVKQVSGSSYVPTTITGTDIVTLISFDTASLYLANVKNLV